MAQATNALLDQLDQSEQPVVLVGHSLGGWLVLRMASIRPAAVRAVVVVDSALFPDELSPSTLQAHVAPLGKARPSMERMLASVDPGVLAALHCGRLTDGYDPHRVLPALEAPVLFVQADPDHGGHLTDADARRAAELLPHAEFVRIDGGGHNLPLAKSGALLAAIRPFLARAEPSMASAARPSAARRISERCTVSYLR